MASDQSVLSVKNSKRIIAPPKDSGDILVFEDHRRPLVIVSSGPTSRTKRAVWLEEFSWYRSGYEQIEPNRGLVVGGLVVDLTESRNTEGQLITEVRYSLSCGTRSDVTFGFYFIFFLQRQIKAYAEGYSFHVSCGASTNHGETRKVEWNYFDSVDECAPSFPDPICCWCA